MHHFQRPPHLLELLESLFVPFKADLFHSYSYTFFFFFNRNLVIPTKAILQVFTWLPISLTWSLSQIDTLKLLVVI